ncbi:SRPBCC family protein [Aquipuribacter sp. SD81]|uniref:SRPBCC family protein n=1 Tax=Aquipuribacter sp. SD81 TaxID=3127703 RepID=UPI00301991CE
MTAHVTGRLDGSGEDRDLVLERRFDTGVEDVWSAITDPERLGRWFGTWTGDPASGSVRFRFTAEGEDVPESVYDVRVCEPPRSLRVRTVDEHGTWDLSAHVEPDGDGARLTFRHRLVDPDALGDTGPGWEYYLDRLVAAVEGGDVSAVDWDRDYYPVLREPYEGVARDVPSPP